MSTSREAVKRQTHAKVRTSAAALFLERGFTDTTVRDIAEQAGVSVGTVMVVGDKNALLVQMFDSLVDRFTDLPVPPPERSCVKSIVEIVRPAVTMFVAHQDLARIYASILVTAQHESILMTQLSEQLITQVSTTLATHGCTPAHRIRAVADAIYLTYAGILFTSSSRPVAREEEALTTFEHALHALCPCEAIRNDSAS